MLIPAGVLEDGIRFVSTSGPFGLGSGKSGTPFLRMHWANSRRAVVCWGVALVPVNPGGSRFLQALRACANTGELVSTDEPFAIPSIVIRPDAPGSGKVLTPLARMHSANFTAFSRVVAVLLPPPTGGAPVLVLPLLPVPRGTVARSGIAAAAAAAAARADYDDHGD